MPTIEPNTAEALVRDPLALAMLAAWVNCPVDKLPPGLEGHTCEATMRAWKRVGDAAVAYLRAHDAAAGHAIGGLRVAMITASMEDCEDFPEGPCVILGGSVEAVKAAGQLFGEAVALSVIPAAPEATR
jgi:hypothetical protein